MLDRVRVSLIKDVVFLIMMLDLVKVEHLYLNGQQVYRLKQDISNFIGGHMMIYLYMLVVESFRIIQIPKNGKINCTVILRWDHNVLLIIILRCL